MNYDKIGEFIADNRKNKNFTQKELAKKLGVTDKAVSKWERGLGCPDVSILEVLAKELDVSVLEILKGRKIENEVINITEADDYIKESFKVSKDITKNNIFDMISKVIFVLVLFISISFTALSICNYINASKGEIIAIDDFYIEKNKEELERLKNNIELIKNDKSIFTEEEKENLVKDLEGLYKYSENFFVLKLDTNKKYSTNDIMVLYLDDLTSTDFPSGIISNFLSVFKNHGMYSKYIPKTILSNMYKETIGANAFIHYYQSKNQQYFKYQSNNSLIPIISLEYHGDDQLSYSLDMMLASVNDRLEIYNLFIEDLLKVGDINE